jgi:methylenetetrahydrofolate reductase (NADPH)
MTAGSQLEKILRQGTFAVTGEFSPPQGNDVSVIKQKGDLLKGYVDAVNVTDNLNGVVRMSSLAASNLLLQTGLEPVMQVSTRDRNRIAIQSDIFGATALGVKNLLCLTGVHQSFGNQIDSKNVYDLDSVQLVDCVRGMRDRGMLLGNDGKIKGEIKLFIGASANPSADPLEAHVIRLAKKVKAGADFIQTSCVYDMSRFNEWMKRVRDQGIHEKVHLLVGVMPLKSGPMGRDIQKRFPAALIPDALIERLDRAGNSEEEGIKLCIEQIAVLKATEGIRGIHLMTIDGEEAVHRITEGAGLLPRPKVG